MTSRLMHGSGFGWPYTLSPHSIGPLIEDVWPPVFWGAERLPEARRKITSLPWAQAILRELEEEAAQVLAGEPLLPIEPIGWRHDFYSRSTGEHLLFDPDSTGEFVDPADQSVWQGEAFHRAWVLLTHERTYRTMRSLALLYGLTGREEYATWVARGMAKAVRMFARGDFRELSRAQALYFQPLYDAQILAMLAGTYELIKGSPALSDSLHEDIVQGIFISAMPYQIEFMERHGAHNMTCYVDAALAFSGRAVGNNTWIEQALYHSSGGFHAMLRNGLAKDPQGGIDGFWCEGTQFYHLYSVSPLLSLYPLVAEAKTGRPEASGAMPLEEVKLRLSRALMVSAEMADERLRLPVVGDLGAPKNCRLTLYRGLYEMGAGLLESASCQSVLAAIYQTGVARNSIAALLFGPDEVDQPALAHGSVHLPAAGMVFLRRDGFHAYLKASRSPGGHDHPDKLSIGLSAHGQPILADLGTAGYAFRDFLSYCRSTFGHSTVLVDEAPGQSITDASLTARLEEGTSSGATEDQKAGVRLARTIKLQPPLLLISDRYVASPEARRFSFVLHPYGSLAVAFAGTPAELQLPEFPTSGPFAYFTNRRRFTSSVPVCLDWRVTEDVWLRAWLSASVPFELLVGQTPGNPMPDYRSTAVLRAAGTTIDVWAALEVHRRVPLLREFPAHLFPLL